MNACIMCQDDYFESQLLFTTRNGFIKLVSGTEFETNRSVVASTKLDKEDEIAGITQLSAHDILSGNRKVILITQNQLSLGFPLEEVSELKKTSRGVKAITLEKEDHVAFSTCLPADTEAFLWDGKILNAKKVRNRKRGAKGQKAQLT